MHEFKIRIGESSSTSKEEKKDDTINITSEMSGMSFKPATNTVDRSISLDRKIIGYITRTVSEPTHNDELLKNITMKICYETTNTNPNSIYIPNNI